MSFAALHDFCQGLEPKIGRNAIKAKVLEITKTEKIAVMRTDLDVSACRGFYLSARNTQHRFVQQHGCCVIALAREGNNTCWERFVFTKELMHLFDDPKAATDTGDAFDQVLKELVPASPTQTPQTRAEFMTFWMALAALCPEKYRQEFEAERAAGRMDDYAIALRLRIPQTYVGLLFDPRFPVLIAEARQKGVG